MIFHLLDPDRTFADANDVESELGGEWSASARTEFERAESVGDVYVWTDPYDSDLNGVERICFSTSLLDATLDYNASCRDL